MLRAATACRVCDNVNDDFLNKENGTTENSPRTPQNFANLITNTENSIFQGDSEGLRKTYQKIGLGIRSWMNSDFFKRLFWVSSQRTAEQNCCYLAVARINSQRKNFRGLNIWCWNNFGICTHCHRQKLTSYWNFTKEVTIDCVQIENINTTLMELKSHKSRALKVIPTAESFTSLHESEPAIKPPVQPQLDISELQKTLRAFSASIVDVREKVRCLHLNVLIEIQNDTIRIKLRLGSSFDWTRAQPVFRVFFTFRCTVTQNQISVEPTGKLGLDESWTFQRRFDLPQNWTFLCQKWTEKIVENPNLSKFRILSPSTC